MPNIFFPLSFQIFYGMKQKKLNAPEQWHYVYISQHVLMSNFDPNYVNATGIITTVVTIFITTLQATVRHVNM
jgi:hypothetical protein